jgi:transcription initiation factor TFIID TATA-box-binding protein
MKDSFIRQKMRDSLIKNLVSVASVGCRLNMKDIAKRYPKASYKPAKFHGVIVPVGKENAKCLLFESGKIVCVGNKTELESWKNIEAVVKKLITQLDYPCRGVIGLRVVNIVASCALKHKVRLRHLKRDYPQESYWEPEFFPGLRFRLKELDTTVSVFCSGKLYTAGGNKPENTYRAINLMKRILLPYAY